MNNAASAARLKTWIVVIASTGKPMTDPHLAASLKVGEAAGAVYKVSNEGDAIGFPQAVIGDLKIAHAALNRAAGTLMNLAIRNNALAAAAQGDAA